MPGGAASWARPSVGALAAVVVPLTAVVLAACSTDDQPPQVPATSPTAPVLQPGRPGEPNVSLSGSAALPSPTGAPAEADVRFMQDMIVHHAQAIVMVELASPHLSDTQVRALAARVADEQRPEIDAMARWLTSKDQSVPPQAGDPRHGSGAHDHAGMPGMATEAELEQLARARGSAADRLWLTLMTRHHEGALAMVVTQHRDGRDELVTRLGDEIHVTQSAQIGYMREMLDRLA
jgi:uncharacterized protein (DUF305 family)